MRLKLPGFATTAADLGSRDPVLFVHGFPLNQTVWDPQLNELSDCARVLAFDLRGFGTAEPIAAEGIDQLADDCAAALDALRVDRPAVICGLSMGGYIAFALQRRHPARVRALILAATRAGADSDEARANRDRLAARAEAEGAGAVAEAMLPKLFAPGAYAAQPKLVAATRAMMAGASVPGVVGALRAMRDRPDSTPGLAAIGVPTLVVHGAEDQLMPVREAEIMAEGIPGAVLTVLPNAGHLLNLEQPGRFNEAVREFVEGLGG